MGNRLGAYSSLEYSKEKLFCEYHGLKEASAFCVTHKKLICMSCVVQKTHLETDCKFCEIESLNYGMRKCIALKEDIKKANKKLADGIDNAAKTKIESAYEEALANLEKRRAASYIETRETVAKITAREDRFSSELYQKLDEAIDCYNVGAVLEAGRLTDEIRMKGYCRDLVFEKVESVVDEQPISLVKVKEIRANLRREGYRREIPELRGNYAYGGRLERQRRTRLEDSDSESYDCVPGQKAHIN